MVIRHKSFFGMHVFHPITLIWVSYKDISVEFPSTNRWQIEDGNFFCIQKKNIRRRKTSNSIIWIKIEKSQSVILVNLFTTINKYYPVFLFFFPIFISNCFPKTHFFLQKFKLIYILHFKYFIALEIININKDELIYLTF